MCTLNILGSVGALEYMQHMNDPLEGDGWTAVRNV